MFACACEPGTSHKEVALCEPATSRKGGCVNLRITRVHKGYSAKTSCVNLVLHTRAAVPCSEGKSCPSLTRRLASLCQEGATRAAPRPASPRALLADLGRGRAQGTAPEALPGHPEAREAVVERLDIKRALFAELAHRAAISLDNAVLYRDLRRGLWIRGRLKARREPRLEPHAKARVSRRKLTKRLLEQLVLGSL